jgi:hypothetical protein
MTRRLKAGVVEPEETAVAMQRLGKHVPAVMIFVYIISSEWEVGD